MTDHRTADNTAPANLFDPVGYVVLAFGNAADADTARASLLNGGYAPAELLRYTGSEVLANSDAANHHRSLFSYLREEHEIAEDYEAIARDGGAFLLVRAESDAEAARVGNVGRRGDLKRAAYYGPLTFTDLR
jgi:hypothetical protein